MQCRRATRTSRCRLPEHRGRGIGTAAQRLVAEHLFAHTTVHRLEAVTETINIAEQRALAMRYSDQWVKDGCHLESPLVPAERAALVRSYAGLLAAVHRS